MFAMRRAAAGLSLFAVPVLAWCAQSDGAAEPSREHSGASTTATSEQTAMPAPAVIPVEVEAASPLPAERAPERVRSRIIEEVIVTAQKREENLKEVPLSVTALPAETLDAKQILTLQDMPKVTPGLTVTPQASFTSLFLRGVGSDAYALGDPLVVYYVDGVYIPFAQALFADLGVIEQVEVLKGPQGTLFGRNALGGALKTSTKDPSLAEPKAQFSTSYGSNNATKTTAYVSVPLIADELAIGLAGMYKHADHYLDSFHKAERVPLTQPMEKAFQLRVKYVPTDWMDLRLTFSESEDQDARGYNVVTDPGPILLATGYTGQDPRHAWIDHDIDSPSMNRIYIGDLAFHLPWADIKLLASYQDFRIETAVDFDGSDRPIAHFVNNPGIAKTKTAELQFLSSDDAPFSDWIETVFGVYYFDSHAGFRGGLNAAGVVCSNGHIALLTCQGPDLTLGLGSILAPLLPFNGSPVNLGFIALLDTESLSFYNQTKFTITDWMAVTVGARYQNEERKLANSSGLLRLSGDVYDDSMDIAYQHYGPDQFHDTTKKFDPKIAVSFTPEWDWLGDRPLLYASYQTATTSSTFNAINIIPTDRPEFIKAVQIKAYEVGYKTRLFDNLIDLNTAAFYYDITDPQVQFISLLAGGAVTFENAESQRIRGAEIDFTARVLPGLLNDSLILTGNATYLDAIYSSYKHGTGFTELYTLQTSALGGIFPGQDYSGNRITRTPKVAYTVGLLETLQTSRGPVEIGADWSYRSKVYYLAQNTNSAEPGYGLLSGRVSYLYEPWNLRVTAYGDNLLNKDYNYALFILDFGKNATPAPLRTYGLRVNWSF